MGEYVVLFPWFGAFYIGVSFVALPLALYGCSLLLNFGLFPELFVHCGNCGKSKIIVCRNCGKSKIIAGSQCILQKFQEISRLT